MSTNDRSQRLRRFAARSVMAALPALSGLTATGCDDEPSEPQAEHSHDAGDEGGRGGSGGNKDAGTKADSGSDAGMDAAQATDGIYAYVRGEFVNLAASSDLPHDAPELDQKKAREFVGEPWFAGGAVIEMAGFQLRQRKVTDDLAWDDGPTLDFSQYPFGEDGPSVFHAMSVDDHHAYFIYDLTSRIVWDPTEFKIVATKEDSEIPVMVDGLPLEPAGNRGNLKGDGQRAQMAFFWKDEDWWKFAPKSVIALYDRETHEESKLIEIDCPGLAVGTRDEEGNTYWGTWDYKGIVSLYDQGPKPCLARITPEGELDQEFTTDLLELTGGKYGKSFQYVRDGWGLYMVFDHEKTGLDFTKPPSMDGDIKTNPIDYWWNPNYWRLYKVDLKAKTAEPFAPLKDLAIMEYYMTRVDDRIFIGYAYAKDWDNTMTAGDQWEEAATSNVDELLPDDTTKPYSVQGDGRGTWNRVR